MLKSLAVIALFAATFATLTAAAEARGRVGGDTRWTPFFCKDHPGECRVNKSGVGR